MASPPAVAGNVAGRYLDSSHSPDPDPPRHAPRRCRSPRLPVGRRRRLRFPPEPRSSRDALRRDVRPPDPRRSHRGRYREPLVLGDVAVRGDRIAAVGRLAGATARDTDRRDRAGGGARLHRHARALRVPLLQDPGAISKITQGITTEITGEVTSVVPGQRARSRSSPPRHRRVTDWTDLDGYFRTLERTGTAINLGTFVTARLGAPPRDRRREPPADAGRDGADARGGGGGDASRGRWGSRRG
jgi:hypothetical protein